VQETHFHTIQEACAVIALHHGYGAAGQAEHYLSTAQPFTVGAFTFIPTPAGVVVRRDANQ